MQFLADKDGMIRVGREGPRQLVLDCSPLCFNAPKAIDESKLEEPDVISDDIPIEDDNS